MRLIFNVPGTNLTYIINHKGERLSPKEKKEYRLETVRKLPRGFVPLHAVLLKNKKRGIAISGSSGSGKTTLAEILVNKFKYKLVANDFIVVWNQKGNLYASDLNSKENNRGKQKTKLTSVFFVSDKDKRDIYKQSENEFFEHFVGTLYPLDRNLLKKFEQEDVYRIIRALHICLGNKTSNKQRWAEIINSYYNSKKIARIGIIGIGTIGNTLLNLIIAKPWLRILNIISTDRKKLKGISLDLRSANPQVLVNISKTYRDLFNNSDLVVIAFNVKNEPLVVFGGERNMKIYSHAKVIWEISRSVRNSKYRGFLLVVTNPVDIMSWALYEFSNINDKGYRDWNGLYSNQVYGIGLGLDYKRMQVLENNPENNLELVGEHGENLTLCRVIDESKLSVMKNDKLLKLIKEYSPEIRKYTDRTIFGPVHEIYEVLQVIRKRSGEMRVSLLNDNGVVLGDVVKLQHGIISRKFEYKNNLQRKLESLEKVQRVYYKLLKKNGAGEFGGVKK